MLFVLNLEFLLENIINFLNKVRLPSEKLDSLDIIEALINVETSLLFFSTLFLANVRLSLRTQLLHEHARTCKEQDDEAAVANLVENNHRG